MLTLTILTLFVATLTFLATGYVLLLELRAAKARERVAVVWRILDECMRTGYQLQEANPTLHNVWQWVERVGGFCELSLGHHAMRLVFQDGKTLHMITQNGLSPGEVLQGARFRIHEHIAGKVVDGRIHPDFNEKRWKGWTPESPIPY